MLGQSYETLPSWGMIVNGELWELTMSVPRTGETDGGAWPTPDTNTSTYSNGFMGPNLRERASLWMSPSRRDYRTGEQNQPTNSLLPRQAPRIPMPGLEFSQSDQTLPQQWMTPTVAMEGTKTQHDGSYKPGLKMQAAPKGSKKKLNPLFVEWLMGLPPIGWTDLKPLGMESYPSKQQPQSTSYSEWFDRMTTREVKEAV